MNEIKGKRGREEDDGKRPERIVAFGFIITGAAILLLWILFKLLSQLHTVRLSVSTVSFGLIIIGAVILFISVLAERLREKKTDRYRDIEK